MCVIIVKKENVKMPPVSMLRQAAAYNPHGFGFCTKNKLFKTTNFERFLSKLKEVNNEACIIHFRYATTGSVKTANCHPFDNGDVFFAHNGVLNIPTTNDMTDSETFFKNKIMPVIKKFGYDSETLRDVMSEYDFYSKFAMMKNGKIKMFGNFTNIDGCLYSNTRFLNNYNTYSYGKKNVFIESDEPCLAVC